MFICLFNYYIITIPVEEDVVSYLMNCWS